MSAIAIDTLKISNRLKAGGFTEEQAAALTETVQEAVGVAASVAEESADSFATKGDIALLQSDIALVRSEMREMELRLKIHLGGMIMALGGVLIAIKYFG